MKRSTDNSVRIYRFTNKKKFSLHFIFNFSSCKTCKYLNFESKFILNIFNSSVAAFLKQSSFVKKIKTRERGERLPRIEPLGP